MGRESSVDVTQRVPYKEEQTMIEADDMQAREWFIARLNYYRNEDRHECGLIAHRMSWLLTCESFLFTAYAITGNCPDMVFRITFWAVLASIGALLAISLQPSISEAHNIINRWHERERELEDAIQSYPTSTVRTDLMAYSVGRGWQRKENGSIDKQHRRSFWFQRNAQRLFLAIWAATFFITCSCTLLRHFAVGPVPIFG
jgi:hypothetical protein